MAQTCRIAEHLSQDARLRAEILEDERLQVGPCHVGVASHLGLLFEHAAQAEREHGGGSGAAGGAALAKLAAASFIAGLASNVFKIH